MIKSTDIENILQYLLFNPKFIDWIDEDSLQATFGKRKRLQIIKSCGGSCLQIKYINNLINEFTVNEDFTSVLESYWNKIKESALNYSFTSLINDITR